MDEPIVWYLGSGTTTRRWLHADERGSIVAISDASGAVLAKNRYDEYGNPQSGNLGRFQYTGQAWLPEIGMYYYKARMYEPKLGRFMQTDPISYGAGLNWYNYVGSDPVNAIDPSGQMVICTGSIGVHPQGFDCGSITISRVISNGVDISADYMARENTATSIASSVISSHFPGLTGSPRDFVVRLRTH